MSWPSGRSRHGGVDEIPLPEGPGRLWLCGKLFVAPDPVGALSACGADVVVCLCERQELDDRYPRYVRWLEANEGGAAIWFPIPDLHAPSPDELSPLLVRLRQLVQAGQGVLVHCGAGIGRAGTVATALLMHMGVAQVPALSIVARARPLAGPEAGAQTDLLNQLAGLRPHKAAPVRSSPEPPQRRGAVGAG